MKQTKPSSYVCACRLHGFLFRLPVCSWQLLLMRMISISALMLLWEKTTLIIDMAKLQKGSVVARALGTKLLTTGCMEPRLLPDFVCSAKHSRALNSSKSILPSSEVSASASAQSECMYVRAIAAQDLTGDLPLFRLHSSKPHGNKSNTKHIKNLEVVSLPFINL